MDTLASIERPRPAPASGRGVVAACLPRAQANYAKFDQSVQNAMSAGALVTSEGMRLIAQAADATIKAFGEYPSA